MAADLFGPNRSSHAATLWGARRGSVISRLMALFEVLRWRYPDIAEECAAAYRVLRELPVGLLADVFGSPSGLLWLESLEECLEADTAEPASDYIAAVEQAEHGEELCRAVANRLWVFAVAATQLNPVTPVPHAPVFVRGPASFPTTGLIAGTDAFTVGRVGSGIRAINDAVVERLPTVKVGSIFVEIVRADRVLASDCFETTAKVSDPNEVAAFAASLEIAIRLLLLVSPQHEAELAASLRCVVPIVSAAPGVFRSGTPSRALGLSYLTATTSRCHLIDMVIHEAAHNHLFLFQEITDPLLCPEAHGDGWGAPLVYSPWRDGPRPLNGLLHACYVFWCVALFWLEASSTEAAGDDVRLFALCRLSALVPQLEAGLEELRATARWTSEGSQFLHILAERIAALSSAARLVGAESAQPAYVSDHNVNAGVVTAVERQRLHHQLWLARYRS